MAEVVEAEQFAVQYANHYRADGKIVTLGYWDAVMDTTDIMRDLREQGYEPVVLRRKIVREYGDWEPANA